MPLVDRELIVESWLEVESVELSVESSFLVDEFRSLCVYAWFNGLKGLVGFNGNMLFIMRRRVESHSTLWLYSIHERCVVDGFALVGSIKVER